MGAVFARLAVMRRAMLGLALAAPASPACAGMGIAPQAAARTRKISLIVL
jgi:hypothetical protein